MSDFSSIKSSLITIVRGISELNDAAVYDHAPEIANVEYDPFAVVLAKGHSSEPLSTQEERRKHRFEVMLFVERNKQTHDTADSVLTSMVDALIDDLEDDFTLSGTVEQMFIPESEWGFVQSDKEYAVATIQVEVWKDYLRP